MVHRLTVIQLTVIQRGDRPVFGRRAIALASGSYQTSFRSLSDSDGSRRQ